MRDMGGNNLGGGVFNAQKRNNHNNNNNLEGHQWRAEIVDFLYSLISSLENVYIHTVGIYLFIYFVQPQVNRGQVKGTFGTAFVPAFPSNLNFFFLLKLSAVCTFWIVLMCWYQKWFLKNKKNHWHAFQHEKLFEKHPQPHCQTHSYSVCAVRSISMLLRKWDIFVYYRCLK